MAVAITIFKLCLSFHDNFFSLFELCIYVYINKENDEIRNFNERLKVRKSRKKNMLSWILPKNERWGNFMYWKMPHLSFFGRIQDAIITHCSKVKSYKQ